MLRVSILGTGNVAKQLFDSLNSADGVRVEQVAGRNQQALKKFAKTGAKTSTFDQLLAVDIFIIAVSDNAVTEVAGFLKDKSELVVHTAGSVAISAIAGCTRRGVFYPLQTFSKTSAVNMAKVPICIEASNKEDVKLLQTLGSAISQSVIEVSTEQRKTLHLAAVFCNNFTNHMYHIGEHLCKKEGLPFDLLIPLIEQTTTKIQTTDAFTAQSGPARRHDTETLARHLKQLETFTLHAGL